MPRSVEISILQTARKFMSFRYLRRYLGHGPKVFCIGINKTGTTSIDIALQQLGYRTGNVENGCFLIQDWAKSDFRSTEDLCKSGNAFQDIPFSLPNTYRHLDSTFPGSKFVLTVRNSSDEWYKSLTRFHTMLIGKNRLPTAEDLKSFPLVYEGWIWQVQKLTIGVNDSSPYDRDLLIHYYENHNRQVIEHFKNRQDSLLVLNMSEPGKMDKLCQFLGLKNKTGMKMPKIDSETIVKIVHDHLAAVR